MVQRLLCVLLVPAAFSCGGPASTADAGVPLKCHELPFDAMGAPAVLDATLSSNVFAVSLAVGATQRNAVVDTGAPVTLLDPAAFPGETLPKGQGTVARLSLGSLSVSDASVIGAAVGASTADGPVPALVGGDFLCHFATSFDYRQPRVFLGDSALPTDLAAPVTVSAPVLGGGMGALPVGGEIVVVKLPATRIVVSGTLDGVERTFVLDSGASLNVLSPAAFSALVADGRKTLGGLEASTVMGSAGLTMARARTLSVGGAEAQGVLVASLDSPLFGALAREVGRPVDGLLGGTFLREFFVTVDYAGEQVSLRRYPTRAHVHDELTRAGFTLAPITTATPGTPHYSVGSVFAGSDAATQGLTAGTAILAIDGTALEPLSAEAANALLLGAAGTTKAVQTINATVMVKDEDLLAP
jgi:hypothetical protein